MMRAMFGGLALALTASALMMACTSEVDVESGPDRAILWVRDAAEFDALAMQAFRAAGDDLPRLIADKSWTALPGQRNYGQLPPAIIFDVDETLVSNVHFQENLEPPFTTAKLYQWTAESSATAIPGAAEFAKLAREQGVELFFVTNRPCEDIPGVDGACPTEAATIQDLIESGIPADTENVMLANERADWNREKVIRRNLIGQDYRVIMLIGDDLSDFIPCVREKVYAPCDSGATAASRQNQTELYGSYWGSGWYVLPNPMHGSWTTVE